MSLFHFVFRPLLEDHIALTLPRVLFSDDLTSTYHGWGDYSLFDLLTPLPAPVAGSRTWLHAPASVMLRS